MIERENGKKVITAQGHNHGESDLSQFNTADIVPQVKDEYIVEPGHVVAKTRKDNMDIEARERPGCG